MTFRSFHTPQISALSATRRFLPCAAAALALSLPLASHALGEALDIEQPSMRTPVDMVPQLPTSGITLSNATRGPLTREEVREATRMARATGLMSGTGELGDTPELLQRRADFNALQTEVLLAEYQAQVMRAQAEQQAAEAVAQAAVDAASPAGQMALMQAPEMTTAQTGEQSATTAAGQVVPSAEMAQPDTVMGGQLGEPLVEPLVEPMREPTDQPMSDRSEVGNVGRLAVQPVSEEDVKQD